MTTARQGVIDKILASCEEHGLTMLEQKAYVLATVEHETDGTFQAVREAYWLSEQWRQKNLRYYPFYGRGYVQLTWKQNYKAYQELLGIPLVVDPDLALEEDTAVKILVHGFATGAFTSLTLESFINQDKTDFYNARTCINGMDKARSIANLAERHLSELGQSYGKQALSVMEFQIFYNAWLKLLAVKADGETNEATVSAIRHFQSHSGIDDDGIIGPNTIAAYNRHIDQIRKEGGLCQ